MGAADTKGSVTATPSPWLLQGVTAGQPYEFRLWAQPYTDWVDLFTIHLREGAWAEIRRAERLQ